MTKKLDERLAESLERQLARVKKRLADDKYGSKAAADKLRHPEDFMRRQYIWKHNSYLGHVTMMRANLNAMVLSASTTERTKHLARTMLGNIDALQNSLQERVGP